MYGCNPSSPFTSVARIVANVVGFEHEYVHIKDSEKEDYKTNVSSRGVFPFLVTEEGSLGESLAISRFMCNSKPEAGLYGTTVQEQALIDELVERHLSTITSTSFAVYGILGYSELEDEVFNTGLKKFQDYLSLLDGLIKDKEFFAVDRLTLADVYIAVSLNLPFAVAFDAEFRKTIPHLTSWYEKVRSHEAILSILGKPRYCGHPAKPYRK